MGRYASFSDFPKRKNKAGHWLCRWCDKELSGRRTSYCCKKHEQEVCIRCGIRVRGSVYRRDRSICSECGRDCNKIRRELRRLRKRDRVAYKKRVEALGLTLAEASRTLWQAHHVRAVKEGGGECGLDGLQTLCIWCHKKRRNG